MIIHCIFKSDFNYLQMGCCESLPCDPTKELTIRQLKEKNLLTNGSLIFFSSIGGAFSCAIKFVTCNPSSHVGMVFVDDDGQYYLWHSPNRPVSGCIDEITRVEKTGPQLNKLECALEHYNGSFMLRQLKDDGQKYALPANANRQRITDILTTNTEELFKWMGDQVPKKYEQSVCQLLLAACPLKCNYEDSSSYFCSELVAATYKFIGLLRQDTISSNYTPADLLSKSESSGSLNLLDGFILSGDFICINRFDGDVDILSRIQVQS